MLYVISARVASRNLTRLHQRTSLWRRKVSGFLDADVTLMEQFQVLRAIKCRLTTSYHGR